jgi:hypothetical protein
MPDYSKSIIYKLECKDPKVTEIYVGSTTAFYDRKSRHKDVCINKDGKKEWNSYVYRFMRLNGGWNNWQMIQIEEVNARNKRHLNQIEAKYIRDLKAELNSDMPQDIPTGLTREEYTKMYNTLNHNKILERCKVYRDTNREKINIKAKEEYHKNITYNRERKNRNYHNNGDKNREKKKEYRIKNADKIAEKARVKVVCGCGSEVTKQHLARHKRTQKHKEWENLPEPNLIFVD